MNPASLVLILGISHANPQDCGIWYVCNASSPYVLHQNAPTFGVSETVGKWQLGVQTLGRTETDAYVVDNGFTGVFRTVGKEWGVSVLRRWESKGLSLDAGLWVYKSEVFSWINDQYYTSHAFGVAPMASLQYKSVAVTIRGAENRSRDWNGNHQPSPIKGFVTTFEVRF